VRSHAFAAVVACALLGLTSPAIAPGATPLPWLRGRCCLAGAWNDAPSWGCCAESRM